MSKNGLNTEQFLLANKKKLYNYMMKGLTGTEIAKKFGISRSCYFAALKNNAELDDLRNTVRDDIRTRLHTTLIERALGNYTSRCRESVTTYSVNSDTKNKGTPKKVTKYSDKTIVYEGNSDFRALSLALSVYAMTDANASDESSLIDDIDPSKFTYADVSDEDDSE